MVIYAYCRPEYENMKSLCPQVKCSISTETKTLKASYAWLQINQSFRLVLTLDFRMQIEDYDFAVCRNFYFKPTKIHSLA